MTVSIQPRGLAFVRAAIALAMANGKRQEAAEFAAARWGSQSPAARICKNVPAASFGEATGDWGAELAGDTRATIAEFFTAVDQGSILGRMAGIRRVPLRVPMLVASESPVAHWTGEGKPKPITAPGFTRDSLAPNKLIALTVLTEDLLAEVDPVAEMAVRDLLVRAVRDAQDAAFISPTNTGTPDVKPAAISSAASPIAGSNDAGADLRALIAAFAGDLAAAFLILTPELAAGASGADRPLIGARGGEVLGIPVITSRNVPDGVAVLADASAIASGERGADMRVSREGTVEMLDTALQQDATTGTGAAAVSLWQVNAVGVLVERGINWRLMHADAVAVLTGATWGSPAESE